MLIIRACQVVMSDYRMVARPRSTLSTSLSTKNKKGQNIVPKKVTKVSEVAKCSAPAVHRLQTGKVSEVAELVNALGLKICSGGAGVVKSHSLAELSRV